MRISNNIKFIIFICFLLVILSSQSHSQDENDILYFFVKTEFKRPLDNASTFAIYNKYFSYPRDSVLEESVNYHFKCALRAWFENFNINVIYLKNDAKLKQTLKTFEIINTIFVDDYSNLHIKTSLKNIRMNQELRSFKWELRTNILNWEAQWDYLEEDNSQLELKEKIFDEISLALVQKVTQEISEWIFQSSVKFSVKVHKFRRIDDQERFKLLEEQVTSIVESELANSEAIIIFANDSSFVKKEYADYIIDGKLFEINNQLRIDVRCIKIKTQRILASKKVIIDTVTIKNLTYSIADVCHQLKRIMETDFKSASKTLAIIAKPPERLFSSTSPSQDDYKISREIIRTITQKLKLLTSINAETSFKLDMELLDNAQKITEYLKKPIAPSDIISDLDCDYLITVQYEDFGNDVRIIADIHSYDVKRIGISQPIYEARIKKPEINVAINNIVKNIITSLCEAGFVKRKDESDDNLNVTPCDSLIRIDKSNYNYNYIAKIMMPDVRKFKNIGFRLGVTAYRKSPELFLGSNSNVCIEVFYSYMIPNLDLGFDIVTEASLSGGFIGKGSLLFKGINHSNGFINVKASFSNLQYSTLPMILRFGIGLGFQGVKYNFSPGDEFYLGDKKYSNGIVRFATNFSIEIEFPFSDSISFHWIGRYIPGFFSNFNNFKDVRLDYNENPEGIMREFYIFLGFRYQWR